MTDSASNRYSLANLSLETESDVEQKLIYPLLTGNLWLNIPENNVKTKNYLPRSEIDKGSGKKIGYYPDGSIWSLGLPLVVFETKSPEELTMKGFREAQLYAHQLNARYPTDLNPTKFVVSTNGHEVIYGYWDSDKAQTIQVKDLSVGSSVSEDLKSFLNWDSIGAHAEYVSKKLGTQRVTKPISLMGGASRLSQIVGFNSFAEDLAPLLKMYFDSVSPEQALEIIKKAYVSSDETTTYERIFETYLRDRSPKSKDPSAAILEPTRRNEKHITTQLEGYRRNLPETGQLQLIIGPVGAGKSMFARRYYHHLQPSALRDNSFWTFLNFNEAPNDLSNLEKWVCEKFIEELSNNGRLPDIYEHKILTTIFSPEINKVRGAYKYLKENDPKEFDKRQATDLKNWMDDVELFSKSLCRYLIGEMRNAVVVVFDNVDRRDREQQLQIFQVAEWFKSETRSFCLINLRDETYERYKNEPPLDAFLNSIHFYITPPRFADVVKRRLELAINFLSEHSENTLEYDLPNGMTVTYPATALGEYLRSIYVDLFRSSRKITWILEALAGKNVRQALDMFSRIIVSGHLDERAITTTVLGQGVYHIPEAMVLKILMRTNYKYFDDDHGFLTNIFNGPSNAERANNFITIECLDFLTSRRKEKGDIGVEGYFQSSTIVNHLSKAGFVEADIYGALHKLLERGLITADHMRKRGLDKNDCVRIHASGFIHLRLLSARMEYLAGCVPVSDFLDKSVAKKISKLWEMPTERNDISRKKKLDSVVIFLDYFEKQYLEWESSFPFFSSVAIGSRRVINNIRETLDWKPLNEETSKKLI